MQISLAEGTKDIEVIRDLFREYEMSLGLDLGYQGFPDEVAGLPGAYATPSGRLLLAREGEAVAGCVALRSMGAGRCGMKRLYVRPAYRGSGLGRRLVERLIAEARDAGYRFMSLDTLPTMARAQALYLTLGFRDIEPYYASPVPGTRYLGLSLDPGAGADFEPGDADD